MPIADSLQPLRAWALDFAAMYPNADKTSVLCIDIDTRLLPQHPPPNVTFQLGDIFKQAARDWENRFAFVHQRLLIGALKYDQWEEVIRPIYAIIAPGGWAQLLESNYFNHFGDCGLATARALELFKVLGKVSELVFPCSLRLEGLVDSLMCKSSFAKTHWAHLTVKWVSSRLKTYWAYFAVSRPRLCD